jgi:hypothetical protein
MTTIELHGRINDEGKLEVELPEGLPSGDVKVVIEVKNEKNDELKYPLYGLWADLVNDISAEDIDQVRKEMWGNFPREDIA